MTRRARKLQAADLFCGADVLAERGKRQTDQLRWKRCAPEVRAYKLWVAYFDQRFYGGWHGFLENRDGCVWLRDHDSVREKLMRLFPLVLPLESSGELTRFPRWRARVMGELLDRVAAKCERALMKMRASSRKTFGSPCWRGLPENRNGTLC